MKIQDRVTIALSAIDNGFYFEQWGQRFVAKIEGVEFVPYGGVHDGGIDALRVYTRNDGQRGKRLYQFSIEKNPSAKMRKDLGKLRDKGDLPERFYYVTNQRVDQPHIIEERLEEDFDTRIRIWALDWFCVNVDSSPATLRVFSELEEEVVLSKENESEDKAFVIADTDPRVFLYLRQELGHARFGAKVSDTVVDSLIFMALDDTDPNAGIRRSKNEIVDVIRNFTNLSEKWLGDKVQERLRVLTEKKQTLDGIRRDVNHHRSTDDYVLPYHTRTEIRLRKAEDKKLHRDFNDASSTKLREYLHEEGIQLDDKLIGELLDRVFHRLFNQLGLEFAKFLSTREAELSIDTSLRSIVEGVVFDTDLEKQDARYTVEALFQTIRDIIYTGSDAQLEFLDRLGQTYRMLFMLQYDPKLAAHFEQVATNLTVYVDTSIIIPAISEYFLKPQQRRYTNLLIGTADAGVSLLVNRTVINELVAHFKDTQRQYLMEYAARDSDPLLDDDLYVLYIDKILIRAYYYAKKRGQVSEFREFFEHFVSWNTEHIFSELVAWVQEALGVKYRDTVEEEKLIDPSDEEMLIEALTNMKPSEHQAKTDARQILMIYSIRAQNQEEAGTSALGYNTWWLTSDTFSLQALRKVREGDFDTSSPYLRADFLYGYISLAPSRKEVDAVYKRLFPTLLGVNMSYHVPADIAKQMNDALEEHKELLHKLPRLKAKLRRLNIDIMTNPSRWNKKRLSSWWEDAIQEAKSENQDP